MQEINLYNLIKYYAKKWRVIVALTALGLLAGLVYNGFVQKPLYKSDAKLILVSTQVKPATSDPTLINNYIDLIKSRRVLEPVLEKEHSSLSYDKLSQLVQATNQKDTAVIDVTVTTSDAKQSKSLTNDITDSFKAAVTALYSTDNIIVVDPAVAATAPYNVKPALQLVVATLGGLLLSVIGLFFAYDYYQSRPQKKTASNKLLQTTKKPVVKSTGLVQTAKTKSVTAKKKPTAKSRK